MTLLPSLFSPFTSHDSRFCPDLPEAQDVTDPARYPDMMGTVCRLHGCARYLDEAPMVSCAAREFSSGEAKQHLFPNSWTAIASFAAPMRRFGRLPGRRQRLVVVRYCPECREAAKQWVESDAA